MSAQKSEIKAAPTSIYLAENPVFVIEKRVMDIFCSLLLLIILFPLLLLIALFIKLDDSEGNVLFFQERVGKNERPFKMYKFRSMYTDAEKRLEELLQYNEVDGAMFKMKDDPRVTRIGKYLRMMSLDELPQLINVIKGDMSLVGPRPPLHREVEQYSDYDKQRFLVKPGITGLWQVSGRSSLSFEQMVELDLIYIHNLSLKIDLIILIKTIKVVLFSDHAY